MSGDFDPNFCTIPYVVQLGTFFIFGKMLLQSSKLACTHSQQLSKYLILPPNPRRQVPKRQKDSHVLKIKLLNCFLREKIQNIGIPGKLHI